MRKLVLTLTVSALLVVGTAAAAKMKAYVGYDKNLDFSTIKTFDYRDTLDTSVIDKAPPVHEMIKLLIISKLQDSGMKWVEENPDVLVTYHTDEDQAMKMNVTLYSYSYSAGWWWSPLWGSGMDVSSWSRGTLVVDIWNPKTDELVWRGAVVGVVPEDPSPAKAQKTIEKALNLMGKEFKKMRQQAEKK
jgi:hypothetical protein